MTIFSKQIKLDLTTEYTKDTQSSLRKESLCSKIVLQNLKKDEKYPTKQEIAISLVKGFRKDHPNIHVKCVLADTLYEQVISQLKKNQKVQIGNIAGRDAINRVSTTKILSYFAAAG